MDFKKLGKIELENLLKELKLYNDLKKKLWNRGIKLFKRNMNNTSKLEVEYFPSINEQIAYDNAIEVYEKIFNIKPKKEEINFISKKSIWGGIKIYKDDNMVDFSFSKVQNILQK